MINEEKWGRGRTKYLIDLNIGFLNFRAGEKK